MKGEDVKEGSRVHIANMSIGVGEYDGIKKITDEGSAERLGVAQTVIDKIQEGAVCTILNAPGNDSPVTVRANPNTKFECEILLFPHNIESGGKA